MKQDGTLRCGNFVRGLVRRRNFRHPCKSQSVHYLTHTLHCQNPQISPRGNFATFFRDVILPRNYPRPLSLPLMPPMHRLGPVALALCAARP